MRFQLTTIAVTLALMTSAQAQINVNTTGSGIASGGVTGGGVGGGGIGGGQGIGGGGQGLGALGGANAGQGGGISGILNDTGDSTVQGTGFLGRNANNAGFMAGAGTGGAQGANAFGNAGGFGGRNAGGLGTGRTGGNQPGNQPSTRIIRTRITIPRDFGRVIVSPTRIQSNLNSQFQRVSQLSQTTTGGGRVSTGGLRNSRITATPSGNSVVLSGTVRSERDRLVAEKMAKMEPGVDSVINQITVAP